MTTSRTTTSRSTTPPAFGDPPIPSSTRALLGAGVLAGPIFVITGGVGRPGLSAADGMIKRCLVPASAPSVAVLSDT